jgi:hypothetical protein
MDARLLLTPPSGACFFSFLATQLRPQMLEFWQAFPAWMTPLANTNVVVDYIAVCENIFYSSVMMGKAKTACALRRRGGG